MADFARAVAVDVHPSDDRRAVEAMRTLSQFLVWVHREGLPLDREQVFTPDVVSRYIQVGCAHLAEASRATRRSDLRRFGTAVTSKAPWEPPEERLRANQRIVPYSADEVARLLEVSTLQRTPLQRRRMQSLLALGLGAGLYPREIWHVTTDSLVERHGHLCLATPGRQARTIPISPPHDRTLQHIREADPGSMLLGFVAADWDRSRLSRLMQNIELPPDCPALRPSRLRVTWVKEHLEHGVHLGALAQIAGVASWKIFGHVMPFMAPRPEDEVFASMVRR
ncbi:site-specific integrase [Cellulomonas fimi]|uniref:site-specific integrase n=1 Tax=Cellulomonas fimi TaxID=1708 RepID=UPI0002DD3FEC|nr:site-specific integrase [Cellulomonas fimi]